MKIENLTKRADDPTSPSKALTYDYDNIYQIAEVYHVEGTVGMGLNPILKGSAKCKDRQRVEL